MKFEIEMNWSGYSRGVSTWVVEAESEEEARENWCCGEEIDRCVVRDDTESEVESIRVID